MRLKSISKRVLLSALLMAALAALAVAQGPVRREPPERQGGVWSEELKCNSALPNGERLTLRADGGSIRVRTGPGGLIRCVVTLRDYTPSAAQARQYFSAYRLSLRPAPSGVLLAGAGASHSKSQSAQYDLTVPSQCSLDLQTQAGDITVSDRLSGALQATTAGGDIRIRGAAGPVEVTTAGGNIVLGNIGGPVRAKTAGGGIRIGNVNGNATAATSGGNIQVGHVEGTARLKTAGGDVALLGATGAVQAKTSSGQIHIGETEASVRAAAVGGSVRIEGARGRVSVETNGGSIDLLQVRGPVRAQTSAGSIVAQIATTRKIFGASSLRTATGDVRVYLPPTLPVTIDAAIASAGGHKIVSDFPLQIQGSRPAFAPSTVRGRGALNGGGGLLKIRCTGGNIEILKLDSEILRQFKAQQAAFWKRWQEQVQH